MVLTHQPFSCSLQLKRTFSDTNSTNFSPVVPNTPFLYLLKMFSEDRETVHWEQMG